MNETHQRGGMLPHPECLAGVGVEVDVAPIPGAEDGCELRLERQGKEDDFAIGNGRTRGIQHALPRRGDSTGCDVGNGRIEGPVEFLFENERRPAETEEDQRDGGKNSKIEVDSIDETTDSHRWNCRCWTIRTRCRTACRQCAAHPEKRYPRRSRRCSIPRREGS